MEVYLLSGSGYRRGHGICKDHNNKEYLDLAGKVARRAVTELADADGIFPMKAPMTAGCSGEFISGMCMS
ncbi:MAG: hypothetical protein ACLVAW_20285 [Eisenbergiella massiliensis]